MAYLLQSDYKKLIQTDNLLSVIGQDTNVLAGIELTAQAELVSYLTQKYDCTKEFTDTVAWSNATAYKAKNRVYLTAPPYDNNAVYVTGALILQTGNVYRSIAGNAAQPFTVANWTLIGPQYKLFYVTLPFNEFDLAGNYVIGNQVWWKDSVYTNKIATTFLSHDGMLQFRASNNIPPGNIFPDDAINGLQYWGTAVPYSVTAATLPTDVTKWTAADNRSQQMVTYMIDIALYHVHSRIAPRNIPDLRVHRYDNAIKWLKMAGRGEITPSLPLIQPKQGNRIRYASDVKMINTY